MKKLFKSKYAQIGLTAFMVVAASILLFFALLNIKEIASGISKLISIMMPLIFGLVLAYLMHPIVDLFDNKILNNIKHENLRRNLSIFSSFIIIFGIIIALFSFIIPQLLTSIQSIIVNAPDYLKELEKVIMKWLSDNKDLEKTVLDNYDTITSYLTNSLNTVVLPFANSALTKLSNGIFGMVSFLFNLLVGFVFAAYILANQSSFGAGIVRILCSMFDSKKVTNFVDEIKHINHVFSQFMIAKVCDSFCFVFTCTFIFLLVFKYPYALLIAVIIGLTDLIPYFGPYIGTIPSALLICMVNPIKAITFILFIIVLQQIDSNLVTPRIQTQATGLPSFWVLFAITLFGGLFGIVGLLIGVPCFTIIYELIGERIDNSLDHKKMPKDINYYKKLKNIEKE